MAEARLLRRVMHSPNDLLELVGNVENYPKFISLISALRTTKRTDMGPGIEKFEAEATISYKFISENFRSTVEIDRPAKMISVNKAQRGGAVRDLKNRWIFHELSDGSTLVDFFVLVRLKAFPLDILLRDKFDKAGTELMDMFTQKAAEECAKVGDPELDLEAEYLRLGLA